MGKKPQEGTREPLAAPAPAVTPQDPASVAQPDWLLVVEDEEQVLHYLVRYLRQAGYHVLQAASARQALSQLEHHLGRVRLALVDYRLGTQSGLQLSEQLVALQPDLKIILMSGQETPIPDGGELPWLRRRVQKPIFGAELLKVIRDVLTE